MIRKRTLEIIFVAIVLLGLFLAKFQENSLANNYLISKAIVINVVNKRNSGRGFFLEYKLKIGDKSYYSNYKIKCDANLKDNIARFIIGREVSVAYDISNPKNNKVLLNFKDFIKFKQKILKEDSLLILTVCSICLNCQ